MNAVDDPTHPLNGPAFRSGKPCVVCGKPAGTA